MTAAQPPAETFRTHRMINRLEVNYRNTPERPAGLYLDGYRFPYYIHPEVDFNVVDGVAPSAVVQVFANAITVIGVNGEVDEKVAPTLDNDVAWVAATVSVLEALGFKVAAPTDEIDQELAEIDATSWATQAWINIRKLLDGDRDALQSGEVEATLETFLAQAPEIVQSTAQTVLTEGDAPS